MLNLPDMGKLHYLGLLFLNFAVLNILLSLIFFIISIAGRRLLSSPQLKSRLFFVSLVAPPALSFFTVVTSFAPPLFIKIPGKSIFCLNEPYCYIFSFLPPEIPLFDWLLMLVVGLVILPVIYSAMGIWNYFRMRAKIEELGNLPLILKTEIAKELKKIEDAWKIRVKVINTPYMISFLWGYTSNILIISTGILKGLSIEELRCLLKHEISHYRRKDNVLKGILLICRNSQIIFPPVHYIFRWWRDEIELIGDEMAAMITGRPLDVASALLKMMKPLPRGMKGILGDYATGFSIFSDSRQLTERVERLVATNDCRIRPGNRRLSFIPSEIGLLLGMVSFFLISFIAIIAIYKLDPLLLHCYLERLLSII